MSPRKVWQRSSPDGTFSRRLGFLEPGSGDHGVPHSRNGIAVVGLSSVTVWKPMFPLAEDRWDYPLRAFDVRALCDRGVAVADRNAAVPLAVINGNVCGEVRQ